MLVIQGSPALSAFRIEKLLQSARERVDSLLSIDTRYLHFIETDRELSSTGRSVLDCLLNYGNPVAQQAAGNLLLVIPRLGTISPWSTKATEIAHSCGLDTVKRIERGTAYYLVFSGATPNFARNHGLVSLFHDRMTENVIHDVEVAETLFEHSQPRSINYVDVIEHGRPALEQADNDYGLALSDDELDYLLENYLRLGRNPTDVEMVMFAQANSEHCRHKIFNGDWIIDGERQKETLFDMIRDTHSKNSKGVLSAYKDNAAVIEGNSAERFFPDPSSGTYRTCAEDVHVLMKVETHNHPTAISPFPGAATGAGGEIRDEGATGRGAKPKAGLAGFSVSNLKIPDAELPWEVDNGKPERIVSALEVMLEGPIGAAAFNNEFGRPNTCGYFRCYEQQTGTEIRGYHKPIMIAGGLGNIRPGHVEKNDFDAGAKIIVLGGPAMLIGLGGGAASSKDSGSSSADLDFASVQRGNPEMQRRAQEVIDRCWAKGDQNPIQSIHDVGAGGLSNAVPEIIHANEKGGQIDLRTIPSDEPDLSPMEIWCNEAQERYVLVVAEKDLQEFAALCQRERCPFAVIGSVTDNKQLIVYDKMLGCNAVEIPLDILLGKPPKMLREVVRGNPSGDDFDAESVDTREAYYRLLQLPTVADKGFLITIGDRTVGGLVHRDQLVGRWQVPVADSSVTLSSYNGYSGEAMAMGERTPVAILNAPASGRLAVTEAITNIAATAIGDIKNIRLSANWMAATGYGEEDAALFDTVQAVGPEFCSKIGLTIPVGKDSLSMRTRWENAGELREVVAPLSLIVSAFAPVNDIRKTVTPDLKPEIDTQLVLLDLSRGRNRMGGSCLAQVFGKLGSDVPDMDDPVRLNEFFVAIQEMIERDLLLAYHDRSDGGLLVTLSEMAIAGRCGIRIQLQDAQAINAQLFSEEPGVVLQVPAWARDELSHIIRRHGLEKSVTWLGSLSEQQIISVEVAGSTIINEALHDVIAAWSETSYRMQALRDNPDTAREEYEAKQDLRDPGLSPGLSFDPSENIAAPMISTGVKPAVAILREQGVNGQVEMAAAFTRAGFNAVDVHMSDILSGQVSLKEFRGLAACGGFSYGDVLGAGEGWAKSILFNTRARDEFAAYFDRTNTFSLGVCNGCQMLSALQELIPGTKGWPRFRRNLSEQFEGRLSLVEVTRSPSIFLHGMQGSKIPVVVSNGEGRAWFDNMDSAEALTESRLVSLRFVDNHGYPAQTYPHNPNGSAQAITGVTSQDGRITLTMPHPERVFRSVQMSWHDKDWPEDSPWMRMFYNARCWVD